MPCRGDEPGLERNLEAMFQQTYENYHIIIVTDSAQDPAHAIAKSVLSRHPNRSTQLHISNLSLSASGKVAAFLTALAEDRGRADVYAFIDSDAWAPSRWLEDLVDPLNDESVGATTGFRWYFPSKGGLWSYIEEAWNASGTNLLFDDHYNFPWGGAMAIRAETLQRIAISQVWSSAVSDDLTLNSALRKKGYRIAFLPQCTVATFDHTSSRDFLKWATRQTTLTKVLNRGLWNYAMAAFGFFNFAFILGVICLVLGELVTPTWFIPSALLFTPSALGILRSAKRNSAFSRAMPEFKEAFDGTRPWEAIASLIVPWVMTYCIIKSARTHEIEWRGRTYKL